MGLCASKTAAGKAPAVVLEEQQQHQQPQQQPGDAAAPVPATSPATADADGTAAASAPAASAPAAPASAAVGRGRNVSFDIPAPSAAPPAPPAQLPPVAITTATTAAAAAATTTPTPSSPATTTTSTTNDSDTFSPLSPQIEILRATRQQRLRDRRGTGPGGAAAAAAAAAAARQQHPAAPPPASSSRVPRGGCFNALQADLDRACAPRVVEEVRTRAAGVKHIGFGPFKRENQDEFAISLGQGFGGSPGANLFCVFDGHGACGKDAAAYARQQLPLLLDAEMRAYAARMGPAGGGEAALKGAVEVLLAESFADTERALQRAGVNLASSGTTATVVYQRGNRLWVASAGDSRVVLCSRVDAVVGGGGSGGGNGNGASSLGGGGGTGGGTGGGPNSTHSNNNQQQQQQMAAAAQAVFGAVSAGGADQQQPLSGSSGGGALSSTNGGASSGGGGGNHPSADADGAGVAGPPRRLRGVQGVWRAQPLTIDHRPRRFSERERVEAAGGRVAPKRLPSGRAVGEPRLWLADLPSPGLLLSRSLGDLMAASVGCTSDPEVTYATLRPGIDRYMVIASDGVWDVLGNAQVCELVCCAEGGPPAACRRVLDAALGEWEERMSADNVTVVVVEFDWGDGGGVGGGADGAVDGVEAGGA